MIQLIPPTSKIIQSRHRGYLDKLVRASSVLLGYLEYMQAQVIDIV